tara:strand:+ start:606 stop:1739 length:1134 start_codon:yes stop_codon:yes gene_type:complete
MNKKEVSSPFKEMLDNYLLSKKESPKDFKSNHWDVFPDDFEKTILCFDAWERFLRNSISVGFNDEMLHLENKRWLGAPKDKEIDVWALKKSHDYRNLMENVNDKDKLIKRFIEVSNICSLKFLIDNLGSNTGLPLTETLLINAEPINPDRQVAPKDINKQLSINCNSFDLVTIYYFWQIFRTMNYFIETNRPLIAEIGAGYGLLITKIKRQYPNSRCVLFDLPEMSAIQTYYLNCEFPEANILYYKDLINHGSSLFETDFDFLILPGKCINLLPDNSVDLFINMRSMMEMNEDTIGFYFDNIQRSIKENGLFACFNRYYKTTSDKPSILKNYPFDEYWSIVISQTSRMQNHIHDLIINRTKDKSRIPISETLNSLLP